MEGKEELAETLRNFSGAVLLVSHDRALIENGCNRFWWVNGSRLEEWHSLEAVYERLGGRPVAQPMQSSALSINQVTGACSSEDRLLAQLCELEQRLDQELKRRCGIKNRCCNSSCGLKSTGLCRRWISTNSGKSRAKDIAAIENILCSDFWGRGFYANPRCLHVKRDA